MVLMRLRRMAQLTLPAEIRRVLKVREGDLLEAKIISGGVLLKPVAVVLRSCLGAGLKPAPYRKNRAAARSQPVATGSATKRVELPDLIRIRTSCLPEDRASDTAWRTSDGLLTALPPTSRMTSPLRMPHSAAGPSGLTSVTTTPCLPFPGTLSAGAMVSPSGALLSGLLRVPSF